MQTPDTRYARSGDFRLAYQQWGAGPPLLIVPALLSNAERAVRELTGAERDRIYAEQGRRYPGFADCARQTAGVRDIPVLELTRRRS